MGRVRVQRERKGGEDKKCKVRRRGEVEAENNGGMRRGGGEGKWGDVSCRGRVIGREGMKPGRRNGVCKEKRMEVERERWRGRRMEEGGGGEEWRREEGGGSWEM